MSYLSLVTRVFRFLSILTIVTLLFGPAPLPKLAEAQAAGIPISVLQYNVQFLTPWNNRMSLFLPSDLVPGAPPGIPIPINIPREIKSDHWPNVSARAQEIGQAIACHDIVVLNETMNDDRRGTILKAMQDYGRDCGKEYLDWVTGPDLAGGIKVPTPSEIFNLFESGAPTPVVDDEVTIVSRFQITEKHSLIYTRGAGADSFAAKGVIHARLWRGGDAPWNAAIDVFATHLQSGHDDIKQDQIKELTSFIRAHSSPEMGIPILVMGDFNIRGPIHDEGSTDPNYDFLMSQLGGELGLVDIGTSLGGTNGDPKKYRQERIDFIFTSQDGLTRDGGFDQPPKDAGVCTNVDGNPRVNNYCSSNWPENTMSDHAGVEAMLLWHDKPATPPPAITEPKHLSVQVTQLHATSTDSCNQFMDFYARIKVGNTQAKSYGILEGNDIGPDWVVPRIVEANTSPINAYIDIRDEDDLFCGGGDDDVDVNPSPGDRRLWLQIDLVTNRVNLVDRYGNFIQELGSVNQPISVKGESDNERADMVFVVKSEPIPQPPPPLTPGPKQVSVRVVSLQARSNDSCNEKLDSYALLSLQDGFFDLNDFKTVEGNYKELDWKVENLVSADLRTVNFRIQVTDLDDFFCGGSNDKVDISPDPNEAALVGQIDLVSGQIFLPDPNQERLPLYVQQNGEPKTTVLIGGDGGRETADIKLEIKAPTIGPSPAFAHGGVWHPYLCIEDEVCRVGDFNGDGKDDIAAFVRSTQEGEGAGNVWVALSNGQGFDPSSLWHPYLCIGEEVCQVGDFNGDGKDDIAAFVRSTQEGEGAGNVWVALSNGQGFDPSSLWHPYFCVGDEVCQVGDFNGDSKDDIAAFVRSADNNGGGGDGSVFVALSTGTDFQPQEFGALWHLYFCLGGEFCQVGDFNGDGKDDIAAFAQSPQNGAGISEVWVALSNGQGFDPANVWHSYFCVIYEVCGVNDFDGDGKDDIVAFDRGAGGDNRGHVWVALSSGQNFADASTSIWNDFFCFYDCATGDFDGNGAYDVVSFRHFDFEAIGEAKECSVHRCFLGFGQKGNVYVALSQAKWLPPVPPPPTPEPETPEVNLSVRPYTSADFVIPGEKLTYTMAVLNEGNLPGQNVSLVSTLPPSFKILSAQSNQGSCTTTNPVTCQIGDMAVKASVSVEIVARAYPAAVASALAAADATVEPSTLTTLATVSSASEDSDPSDNSESISVTVLRKPRIEVVTTVSTVRNECSLKSKLAVESGTSVYYCYRITNIGKTPVAVHNIVDEELGDLLKDTTFVLEPGESITSLELGVIVRRTIKKTTTSRITWVASVVSGPSASADSTVTVRVREKDD